MPLVGKDSQERTEACEGLEPPVGQRSQQELAAALGQAAAEVAVLRIANESLGRRVLDYEDIVTVQQQMLRAKDNEIARLEGFKKAHDAMLSIPGVIEIVTQYTVRQELNKKLDELIGPEPQKAPEEPLPEAQVLPMAQIGAIFAAMGAF